MCLVCFDRPLVVIKGNSIADPRVAAVIILII